MILCFHGFLGGPQDFSFFTQDYDLIAPELDQLISSNVEEISCLLMPQLSAGNDNVLIGYSFGARLAMQIFLEKPDRFKRVILLAGHCGLKESEELIEREIIENNFLETIEENSFSGFLEYWNDLSLFEFDEPLDSIEKSQEVMKLYFKNFGLSKQPYLKDELLNYKEKILWMFGEKDVKYSTYAKESLMDFDVTFISSCGHRLLKNKNVQEKLIKEIGIC